MAAADAREPSALSVGSSIGDYWWVPRLPAFMREAGEIALNIRTRVVAVDFGLARVDASLEFGDGKRPGKHCDFVVPLKLLPYATLMRRRHRSTQIVS